jgi:hypothetical protein
VVDRHGRRDGDPHRGHRSSDRRQQGPRA